MTFWKDIAEHITKDDLLKNLTQQECEAVIDALNLLVYADGQETVLERAELENLIHDLPWVISEGNKADAYLKESALLSLGISQNGKSFVKERAFDIATRLQGAKLRKRTLKMAAAVAYADWNAGEQERFTLLTLAEAFEIPAPFAHAIIADIENESRGLSFLDEPTEPELVPRAAEQTIRNVISSNFLQGFFHGLFEDNDLKHLSSQEALAFIDALSIALVADGYPEKEELTEFKTQLEKLPFSSEDVGKVQLRVESCLHTLRATPDDELDNFINEVAVRIPSEHLRERALIMAIHITHADLDITEEEQRMLVRLAQNFDISSERLNDLILSIKEDTEEGFLAH